MKEMRIVAWAVLALIPCFLSGPLHAAGRPYIYGCGVTWGEWLGMTTGNALLWNQKSMDKIVEMGGTNIGGNFAWIDIEPSQGSYQWDRADRDVDNAAAHGLEMFAYSGLTPDWALPPEAPDQPGIGYRFPPDEAYAEDFNRFFTALASRYCGRVRYYEFWNEPNGCGWINDGCDNVGMADTYVPWLQRWYTAMKAGCADTVLSIGGLDCNPGSGNACVDYLDGIYGSGGGGSFDAVALHPYGDTSEASALNWSIIHAVYDVMVAHGDGGKPIWLNEYGWDTADEATKARLVEAVLSALERAEYDMVSQASYLIITDLPGTPDSGHDFGLCSRDTSALTITPRESWYAFRDHEKIFFVEPENEEALEEVEEVIEESVTESVPDSARPDAADADAVLPDATSDTPVPDVREEGAAMEEGGCGCRLVV